MTILQKVNDASLVTSKLPPETGKGTSIALTFLLKVLFKCGYSSLFPILDNTLLPHLIQVQNSGLATSNTRKGNLISNLCIE